MIDIVIVILLIVWLGGLGFGYELYGFIHALLIVALILLLVRFLR